MELSLKEENLLWHMYWMDTHWNSFNAVKASNTSLSLPMWGTVSDSSTVVNLCISKIFHIPSFICLVENSCYGSSSTLQKLARSFMRRHCCCSVAKLCLSLHNPHGPQHAWPHCRPEFAQREGQTPFLYTPTYNNVILICLCSSIDAMWLSKIGF